jgi:hypothetical protein
MTPEFGLFLTGVGIVVIGILVALFSSRRDPNAH